MVSRKLRMAQVTNIGVVRTMFFTAFVSISMQSSTAIFSNYYLWTVASFLLLAGDIFVSDDGAIQENGV